MQIDITRIDVTYTIEVISKEPPDHSSKLRRKIISKFTDSKNISFPDDLLYENIVLPLITNLEKK